MIIDICTIAGMGPNTKILFKQEGVFDDIPASYQSWQSKQLRGESIVFRKKDLNGRKDTELVKKIKASNLVQMGSQITLSRNPPDYLVINFNVAMND